MTAPDCSNGCREATTVTEGISEQCGGGRGGYHAAEEGAGKGSYNQVDCTMFIRIESCSSGEKVSALPYYAIFTNSTCGKVILENITNFLLSVLLYKCAAGVAMTMRSR